MHRKIITLFYFEFVDFIIYENLKKKMELLILMHANMLDLKANTIRNDYKFDSYCNFKNDCTYCIHSNFIFLYMPFSF